MAETINAVLDQIKVRQQLNWIDRLGVLSGDLPQR
jgi:hypothetical protein